ncbi:Malic enzyme, NAD-binding protein [Moelleriella libera RCEF 2490]|uniref:Malic enzyme n=1 Tax=Moelleriella libera RCEF 2490 TaxID=1081109 RepID=A0A166U340_9HYPO|nr:Malic enzyme, NAD-binding protein [Moelleriella libera RCEF 2490]
MAADENKFAHLALNTTGPIDCALSGAALLNTPYLNKGSAFPTEERRRFGLTGLLPQNVQTLQEQVKRAHQQYLTRADDLAKNTFLASLKEQNEVLYYRLLQDNLKDMFSVVYTPTEGDAIQNYSRLFRRPEGCFLNINDQERIEHDMSAWGNADDVDYIVVTDGEEILGIGDQGVGGILISVAKLVLATLCAGVHPNRCLPVVLDCGTDNEDLLGDELYLGIKQKRTRGETYEEFVDKFVKAARKFYPKAYIHFEDFGLGNARRLLETYRPKMACFNDDVQGTGCVTLAAIMAGLHVSGKKLTDVRMVVFGAGSAGVGIADQVRDAIATERNVSQDEAAQQIWLIDRPGLLLTSTTPLSDAQKPFAKDPADWENQKADLLAVIQHIKPNVLVGTSTVAGAFTQQVVEAMAAGTPRPIIMPLSNPTRLHEAKPEDILRWTDGKALCATGSPFSPVKGPWGGGQQQEVTIEIAECNNSVVFPGIGLGCILSRASLLTDKMLVAAVQAVAGMSPALKDATAPLLPDVDQVRRVSLQVAKGIIKAAVREKVATEPDIPGVHDDDDGALEEWIKVQMWEPEYRPLRMVRAEEASRVGRGEMREAGTVTRAGEA